MKLLNQFLYFSYRFVKKIRPGDEGDTKYSGYLYSMFILTCFTDLSIKLLLLICDKNLYVAYWNSYAILYIGAIVYAVIAFYAYKLKAIDYDALNIWYEDMLPTKRTILWIVWGFSFIGFTTLLILISGVWFRPENLV